MIARGMTMPLIRFSFAALAFSFSAASGFFLAIESYVSMLICILVALAYGFSALHLKKE